MEFNMATAIAMSGDSKLVSLKEGQ